MQRLIDILETLRRLGQKLGPYVMLEILLPGGSLFALILFLYQRRRAGAGRAALRPAPPPTRLWASFLPQCILMPQPCYLRSRVLRSAIDSPE